MIGDMPTDGWIDRLVPAPLRPYLKLMRLDRPIGTWLLLFPCWWSITLAMATQDTFAWGQWLWLMGLFGVGAVVMRGAGCIVNDVLDRDIDAKVARTAARPLASGAVSVRRALAFLGLLLVIGLGILVQLNKVAILLGAASLLLVAVYPLMKRVTYWPQAWLGLTFNWGALLGWAAVTGSLDWPPVLLYCAGLFWTLGYDTLYAHQDKEDDALVGVKSSALALGDRTRPFTWAVYALALALTAAAGAAAGLDVSFYLLLLGLAGPQLAWQAGTIDLHRSSDCLSKFRSNRYYGWLVLLALLVAAV